MLLTPPMGASSSPGYSSSNLGPCLQPGKAVEPGPSPWAPSCTHVGDLGKAHSSQLWASPTPATVAIWRVNQQTKGLSLTLSLQYE